MLQFYIDPSGCPLVPSQVLKMGQNTSGTVLRKEQLCSKKGFSTHLPCCYRCWKAWAQENDFLFGEKKQNAEPLWSLFCLLSFTTNVVVQNLFRYSVSCTPVHSLRLLWLLSRCVSYKLFSVCFLISAWLCRMNSSWVQLGEEKPDLLSSRTDRHFQGLEELLHLQLC